jgi:hypothetical protein
MSVMCLFTAYEIDFAKYYNKLCGLGAKNNETAYLFPIKILDVKI